MKKLLLNVDSLEIQTFAVTEKGVAGRGTVLGRSTSYTLCGAECTVGTDLTNCNSHEFPDCFC